MESTPPNPSLTSYFWDPQTEAYEGDIDDYPFICREHGFAGDTYCLDCYYEEIGEPRPQPQTQGIGGPISPSDSGSTPVAEWSPPAALGLGGPVQGLLN